MCDNKESNLCVGGSIAIWGIIETKTAKPQLRRAIANPPEAVRNAFALFAVCWNTHKQSEKYASEEVVTMLLLITKHLLTTLPPRHAILLLLPKLRRIQLLRLLRLNFVAHSIKLVLLVILLL